MPAFSVSNVSLSADNVLLGRQPIIDKDREVFGYELLYRGEGGVAGAAGNVATSRVLVDSLINIGFDSIVGDYPAFINATGELLVGDEIELLPRERVVFEILETTRPGKNLGRRLAQLAKKGFRFALDDFVYDPSWDPILEHVAFVKLDVLAEPIASRKQLERLRRPGIQLVAEKVETYEEFLHCLELGFDLFQGYFFCRPETLRGRATSANKLTVIRVLGALSDPTINTVRLAALISEDATLCYQLLRLCNSVAVRGKRAIDTIEDAVVRVGMDNIRHWASLLLLTQAKTRKPHELLFTAMTRARMCELLAQQDGVTNTGPFFVAGLLSIVDALLDQPFEELIVSMPLSEQLREGLLVRQNEIGKRLNYVLAYERMLANGGTFRPEDVQLHRLRGIYFDALRWAQQLETRVQA
jgi:EAL and modified HD-GYP domain-containing signal transduction protein